MLFNNRQLLSNRTNKQQKNSSSENCRVDESRWFQASQKNCAAVTEKVTRTQNRWQAASEYTHAAKIKVFFFAALFQYNSDQAKKMSQIKEKKNAVP